MVSARLNPLLLGMTLMLADSPRPAVGQPACGPLQVSGQNPRYFACPDGRIVYLVGSHTWSNFKDMGATDPAEQFDYECYLDTLVHYHHNFIRLWAWELTRYAYSGKPTWCVPFPWPRTGPGLASDGKLKFDLSRFDETYFERLRARVRAAGERGIYVSIMLFEGHGLHSSDRPWCWDGHPFNRNNNINSIDGDPDGNGRGLEIHTLQLPAVTALQEAYVRKVVETVNDLDNVLYEIANEAGNYSTQWQYHMIDFIHQLERTLPKQHPVGMTFQWAGGDKRGTNEALFASPADWISPSSDDGYRDNPPPADGSKVIINDTDHLWGIGGNRAWVWKSFCRGLNPIFMDPWTPPVQSQQGSVWTDHLRGLAQLDPKWDPVRLNLGYTRRFAERMDLARSVPHGELTSTGYCLATPGVEYLIYAPAGGEVTVDLSQAEGNFALEWFNPATGESTTGVTVAGGAKRTLTAPFAGESVARLTRG